MPFYMIFSLIKRYVLKSFNSAYVKIHVRNADCTLLYRTKPQGKHFGCSIYLIQLMSESVFGHNINGDMIVCLLKILFVPSCIF